jgi:uncharacterized low-complexity protein
VELFMNKSIKSVSAIWGTAFIAAIAQAPAASAAENPFASAELQSATKLAAHHEEGKCGAKSEGEGKCGAKSEGEGKCGAKSEGEGKCGEGKCGAETKAAHEGKCGSEMKTDREGKCGSEMKTDREGKCGAKQ